MIDKEPPFAAPAYAAAGSFESMLALSRKDDAHQTPSAFSFLDHRLSRYLIYPEDAHFIRSFAVLSFLCAFAFYINLHFSWAAVDLFTVLVLLNNQAIARFLHATSHRKFFKPRFNRLNHLPVWLLSPWFGDPPYFFGAEHVANHHACDNSPDDIGSTLPYQRDSLISLGRYLLNFFLGTGGMFGMIGLFASSRGGRIWRLRFLRGQSLFWMLVLIQMLRDWRAALAILVGPFVVLQILNRVNNWTEHAFINPALPLDPLGNTYTIINSRSNAGIGGNEGYHGTHHLRPGLPNHLWPEEFREHIEKYAAADHLVFQKTSTLGVFLMVSLRRYRQLAKRYVPFPGRERTEAEIVELLRGRLAPIET